jgi:predicted RNase H-like HicB family nuclease
VPDLPACFSAGDSLDAAVENVEEAILPWLEYVVGAGKAPHGLSCWAFG